ncbi:hypothetical protein THIOM_000739, partial [Candidatus Thiomargarita nelsonii]
MQTLREFDEIYQATVTNVMRYWTPAMQAEIAKHCYDWGRFDFNNYLRRSSIRFYKAYQSFATNRDDISICDVGGFWGIFPLMLKRLGFKH